MALQRRPVSIAMVSALALSCAGTIDPPGGAGGSGDSPAGGGGPQPAPGHDGAVPRTGMRRLSKAELRSTIKDLVSIDPIADLSLLPEESGLFGNDYTKQSIDSRFVGAVATIADDVAHELMKGDPIIRNRVIGCGSPDAACRTQFITSFGRRVLRRPLDSQVEIPELEALARSETDFFEGVELVIRALLQQPEFLYRIEIGAPTDKPELSRLGSWEMATRLSYLLWGTSPSDELLDMAAKGGLEGPADVRQVALGMLSGDLGGPTWGKRARERVARFHAMWLGYEFTTSEASVLGKKMLAETGALLERTIFQKHVSWFDIFRAKDTFIDRTLAAYYGDIPRATSSQPGWVAYGTSKRRGILSHGTFLSVGNASNGDSSLTRRGKSIRNRLLCQEISSAPPEIAAKVDTSKPPEPRADECRIDVIKRTTLAPGTPCAGCHQQMDPIGLGLENYDATGKYRATDNGKPACKIAGAGQLSTQEPGGETVLVDFQGPAGLADLLADRDAARVEQCLLTQFLSFANGRTLRPTEAGMLEELAKTFKDSGQRFDELLLAFITAPEFGYRLAE